jgi:hypothetical protein
MNMNRKSSKIDIRKRFILGFAIASSITVFVAIIIILVYFMVIGYQKKKTSETLKDIHLKAPLAPITATENYANVVSGVANLSWEIVGDIARVRVSEFGPQPPRTGLTPTDRIEIEWTKAPAPKRTKDLNGFFCMVKSDYTYGGCTTYYDPITHQLKLLPISNGVSFTATDNINHDAFLLEYQIA